MELEKRNIPPANENAISQLWEKFFPYWPVFLLLIALAIGGAWFYLHFKLSYYESSATILIKDDKKGSEDSKMLESLNLLSSKKIMENEIEVIKSRALMNQVVKELKLYAPISQKGSWVDHSAYSSSPVKIEVKNPDSLIEVQKVSFTYDAAKKVVKLYGQNYQLNKWLSTPWGMIKFSPNNTAYYRTAPLYFALINPKRVVQNLIASLYISSSSKLSTVVNLKLWDEVPQRSEDILNALLIAYDKASINDKNVLAQNTLAFLDERLSFVAKDLAVIEKQLQQYRARNGAIDISTQGRLFLTNVSANDQKLSEVNMKLAVLKRVEQYVISKDSHGGVVPSTLGVEDPLLSNLLDNLYKAEIDYEKLKRTTGENNPELVSIADQIEKIKPSILENIHSQQRGLEANKSNLFSTNSAYNASLQALPQQERDLVEINREQNIKSSIYTFLLQKREEAALSYSSTVSDTRLVDKAESSLNPVGMGNSQIYAIAAFIAFAIGIVGITIREMFNKAILFRQEIENLSSFPIIGEIALEKSKTPLVLFNGSTSFIAEEFRLLRTSLQYLGIDGYRHNKILITSTISGEGKSFVAINLAMTLAMGGKKVILVEFDLNNPTLSYKLGIKGGKGVADYLAGHADLEEVIIKTGDNPNFFLMTAGNLPENPSELILQQTTKQLLHQLEEKFDYVLIDAAPVGLLSDGYILSKYCDATLYIVRHNHTPKKMLHRLEQNNKINELKNLAIVFNGVEARGFGKYTSGYGYMNYEKQKKA